MMRITHLIAAATLISSLLSTTSSNAATVTFEIEIGGAFGTFQAPDTGGLIESFAITVDGTIYDFLGTGVAAPTYNAANNDIRGNPGTEGFIQNSLAGGACAAMECVLGLEDSVDPGVVPPLFAIFPLIGGIPGIVSNAGTYEITSIAPVATVPLPATAPFLFAGLGLLFPFAAHRR